MALYDSHGKLVLPTRARLHDSPPTPGATYQLEAIDAVMPNLLPGMPAYQAISPRNAG